MRAGATGSRFTIVELMIAVAIVSILAAIAVPLYQERVVQTRFVEAKVNYDGLRVAVLSITSTQGWVPPDPGFNFSEAFHPDLGAISKKAQPWNPDPGTTMWGTIGWAPDGDVRCSYAFVFGANDEVINVACDVDGDGDWFCAQGEEQNINATPDQFGWLCSGNWQANDVSPSARWLDQPFTCY